VPVSKIKIIGEVNIMES